MDAVRNGHPMIVTVQHACANGWHEFTCPQVPGFAVLSEESNLESAYQQVPEAMAEIVEGDEGFPVTVTLEHTYSQYVENLPAGMRPAERHYSIKKVA